MDTNKFDPSGVGLDNGHFIGLPFTEDDAKVVVISVPWDVTVSYNDGTSRGPANILKESTQLDLEHPGIDDAWKMGIYVNSSPADILKKNNSLRELSSRYIEFLEEGGDVVSSSEMYSIRDHINKSCIWLNEYVYNRSKELLSKGKIPAILGGEHSTPLGLMRALKESHVNYGVLQIDAHMDLRKAYEGFKYSHASIFYNAISEGCISKLTQVGIRDYCKEEVDFAKTNNVSVFYDYQLKNNEFEGKLWKTECDEIIKTLPEIVYISFDIDGLSPSLCPGTGTPVPGGLTFNQAMYLINQVVASGRKIIGFDLCEVGGLNNWDGNVGARVLYYLSNLTGVSNSII